MCKCRRRQQLTRRASAEIHGSIDVHAGVDESTRRIIFWRTADAQAAQRGILVEIGDHKFYSRAALLRALPLQMAAGRGRCVVCAKDMWMASRLVGLQLPRLDASPAPARPRRASMPTFERGFPIRKVFLSALYAFIVWQATPPPRVQLHELHEAADYFFYL